MRLIWTELASRAKNSAIRRLARLNATAAQRQLNEIERQANLLALYPAMGKAGRIPGTRELVVSRTPYILIYRVSQAAMAVEILRLLHTARLRPVRAKK
ncbi:type II toxin-antitoxin system RelE/ParE family toxin [Massilia sp. NR 4-1]|uniref:type II toxin-antitoxin system RelE/ParE family toxin n=1 Tax=Massilia sp. NR 4-1 TaxID=1678028 RepID=UPI0009E393A5|nr:type II toxin-antitoxin system RelE/ParE family toxin [Massilia sp. NR 4-1]